MQTRRESQKHFMKIAGQIRNLGKAPEAYRSMLPSIKEVSAGRAFARFFGRQKAWKIMKIQFFSHGKWCLRRPRVDFWSSSLFFARIHKSLFF